MIAKQEQRHKQMTPFRLEATTSSSDAPAGSTEATAGSTEATAGSTEERQCGPCRVQNAYAQARAAPEHGCRGRCWHH